MEWGWRQVGVGYPSEYRQMPCMVKEYPEVFLFEHTKVAECQGRTGTMTALEFLVLPSGYRSSTTGSVTDIGTFGRTIPVRASRRLVLEDENCQGGLRVAYVSFAVETPTLELATRRLLQSCRYRYHRNGNQRRASTQYPGRRSLYDERPSERDEKPSSSTVRAF